MKTALLNSMRPLLTIQEFRKERLFFFLEYRKEI